MRSWKSYFCSKKLDVNEENVSFTEFNRIRNHFLVCWIDVGRYTRAFFLGLDRLFTETRIRMINFGETRINLQCERKFMERLMI